MPQPAALSARMKPNMAARRPHSRADNSRSRWNPDTKPPFLRGLVLAAGQGRRPDSSPAGASPLRDSAGFTPDFAELAAPPGARPVGRQEVTGRPGHRQV